MSPLCENYLKPEELNQMEAFYPLHVLVCESCFLVQLQEYVSPQDIFSEYAYFSSYSNSWLNHAKTYVDMVVERFKLGPSSLVVELASNDGYLLQFFLRKNIPIIGIEPAENIAKVAEQKGVPTLVRFFGRQVASELIAEGKKADLIVANNVVAQVPDINDFVSGISSLLSPNGIATIEFPHLLSLIQGNQLDTIYHEHFSYFSLFTIEKILKTHGLKVFDIEKLSTHGGSLRVFATKVVTDLWPSSPSVINIRREEDDFGITSRDAYRSFSEKAKKTKRLLLKFLIDAKCNNKVIVGYGAPGKGNTLLNYCGIRTDFIDYTVDKNPYKQGKMLPGSHIPVYHPDEIKKTKPDFVLILPWNLKEEIMRQLDYIRDWKGKMVVPIPEVEICP